MPKLLRLAFILLALASFSKIQAYEKRLLLGSFLTSGGIALTAFATYKNYSEKKNAKITQNKDKKKRRKKNLIAIAGGIVSCGLGAWSLNKGWSERTEKRDKKEREETTARSTLEALEKQEWEKLIEDFQSQQQSLEKKLNAKIDALTQQETDERSQINNEEDNLFNIDIKSRRDRIMKNLFPKFYHSLSTLENEESSARHPLYCEEEADRKSLVALAEKGRKTASKKYNPISNIEEKCKEILAQTDKLSFGDKQDKHNLFKQSLENTASRNCKYEDKEKNLNILKTQTAEMIKFYEKHRAILNQAHEGNTSVIGHFNALDMMLNPPAGNT